LKVSKSSLQIWWITAFLKKTPLVAQIKYRVTKLSSILHLVESSLRSDPFLTCKKLKTLILEKLGVCVSKELVRMSIVKLTYTRKKVRFYGLAKNALNLNRTFFKLRNYYINRGREIFSIDETGFGRFSYNRGYGYAKQGKPLFVRKEKPRMTSISVIACASKNGWSGYKSMKGL
jgi:hypothetical protein